MPVQRVNTRQGRVATAPDLADFLDIDPVGSVYFLPCVIMNELGAWVALLMIVVFDTTKRKNNRTTVSPLLAYRLSHLSIFEDSLLVGPCEHGVACLLVYY